MRKQHPAIVALDTLAGFGSHRAGFRNATLLAITSKAIAAAIRMAMKIWP